jgi:hypothetical protein
MFILIAIIIGLTVPAVAQSQVNCFSYNGGKMLSCDGPRGTTMQTELSPGKGIISGPSGVEPYSIIGADRDRRSVTGIEPLQKLDRLPSFSERMDRMDRDSGLMTPLFLDR